MSDSLQSQLDAFSANEKDKNRREHYYLETRVDYNRRAVEESIDEVKKLRYKVDDLIKEMEETRKETRALVRLWETASGVVLFFKWTIGAVTALLVLWALLSETIKKTIQ